MKELMQTYLRGEATEQERMELLSRLRTDERIGSWLRADMEFSDSRMPQPVQERILRNIVGERSASFGHRRLWTRIGLAACIVVLLALCGLCGTLLWQQSNTPDEKALCEDIVVSTQLGEHSHVTLPDGTILTLNAQTTVRYNLADGKRQVSIDGEAFFEVARDPEHPFVVSANGMTVTCLGTSFDVRNYSDESTASVVLRDGKVRVNACDADLTMEPGSRVLMDRQTFALSKHTVTPSDYTAWLNGEIKFNNQTLEEIAAELSRNYNIDLVITSDELKQERFNGYLGRSSLRNILDVLCLASDMSYHVDNDTMVYIYPRKKR